MTRFLIVFVSVYSLMHAFFYFRVKVLLPYDRLSHFLVIIFLSLMIFAPIGTRLLERADHYNLARAAAMIGYPWVGFIFYAFLLFFTAGVVGLFFKLVNITAGTHLPLLTGKTATACILASVAAICLYGFFEAGSLRVERVRIPTAKLPDGVERLRIAQISDIHLGLLVRQDKLEKILETVKAESPDILVSTGDLVDGDMEKIGNLPELFATINPRYGKWAVTGNHEVYAGLSNSINAENAFGFDLLRGSARTVGHAVNIVGVDDPAAGSAVNETTLLKQVRNGLFTILLKHRPDPERENLGLFDLQLSGHTHYGQLFPFRCFSRFVYPLQNGPYFLEKGSVLYTSRGSATWGPPMRVLAPPEVTIIDIVRE